MDIISDIMLERGKLTLAFNKQKNYRIVAVCAPAGYGKTVAVTQWIKKDDRAKAILPVDEYDNNPASFCERFCAALNACQPQNKTLLEIISHPSFLTAPDVFTLRAISALSSRKQAVLVIDDLHLIHNREVLKLLHVFIKRLPKNFQVVLISRHDFPLELSDLLIKGQVAHINAEKLLFTNKDIMALYKKRGKHITWQQVKDIGEQTQGWVMGINAYLLSGGNSSNPVYEYLDDFLQSNIWEKWDEATREFMLRTSALREMTPPLCEALTGISHSDKFLKELLQKGAFITQLESGVYRYHHLLLQFLRQKVKERGDEFERSLWEAEGEWHMSKKDFYYAIDCFIRSKNHDGIVQCFDLLNAPGRNDYVVMKLLPIIKHPEVRNTAKKYPHMLFLMALFTVIEGKASDAVSILDECYAKYPEIVEKHPTYEPMLPYMLGYDFRISLNQMMSEMKVLPTTRNYFFSAWMAALHMPVLHRGIRDFSDAAIGDVVESGNAMLSNAGWMAGEESSVLVETIMAGLLYEQGHLEKAYEHAINAKVGLKDHFMIDTYFCAMSIIVCVLDALDEKESNEADAVLQSISNMIEENRAYHLSHDFSALTLRRKFTSGNIKAAEEWLDLQADFDSTLHGVYYNFTTSRAFIIIRKYDSAIIMLKKVLKIASAYNRPLDTIEARILLAIAYWKKKRGFQREALEHLEVAVFTAYPYGYTQMFVNDGVALTAMLHKLMNRAKQLKEDGDKPISFIKMLYSKVQENQNIELSIKSEELSIKYTDKQKAIMNLLCQGKSYRETAEALGIKYSTLRSHIELIYKKLEAVNMEDAIKRINAMKLLE